MRIICLILILISFDSFGQDCTLYNVTVVFKGSVLANSSASARIKVPALDFIQGYHKKAFKDVQEEFSTLNNSFEITIEDVSYDLYNFQYHREFLPVQITLTDLKGHSKAIKVKIPKEDFSFEFHREEQNVQLVFNLGEIILD